MPIRTRLTFAGWKVLIIAIVCIVLSAWGAYDLWVSIPRREGAFATYETAKANFDALDDARARQTESGRAPTAIEAAEYDAAARELADSMPAGKTPKKPGKWDRLTQWFFILCGPCAIPYVFWFFRLHRRQYELDESGALHFAGDAEHGAATWPASAIAGIDMSRWMKKSIATVEHAEGARLTLDAYYYKDLDRIVGAIAARLHPEQWTADAKPVKREPASTEAAAEPAGGA